MPSAATAVSATSGQSKAPALIERVYGLSKWRWQELELGSFQEVKDAAEWLAGLEDEGLRWRVEWYLARADLWYLVRYVCSQGLWIANGSAGVVSEKWLYDRCREIEVNSDQVVDIWSRFHWKSILKTQTKSIQEALRDPEVTIVIFSHTRPLAKSFLGAIQQEIMTNRRLIELSWSPLQDREIFSGKKNDYIKMSLNEGITVPRFGAPKEATFSAFGLVDSMPTGGHWIIRILDDAVTKDSVTTPEQMEKLQHSWELSLPLGMPGGRSEEWVTGTFYALGDLYHELAYNRGYELRLHPCYPVDWKSSEKDERGRISRLKLFFSEDPVLYKPEKIKDFETTMGSKEGSSNLSMQLYCDPNAGAGGRKFEKEWLTFYDPKRKTELIRNGNILILADSAGAKRTGSDYTAMWSLSLMDDGCAYAVDMCRDRMSLTERGDQLLRMHGRVAENFYECRYERYGMMADIEFIDFLLKQKKRRMKIIRVGGVAMSKEERIERLIPWFEDSRIILPEKFMYRTKDGDRVDLVEQFIYDEYLGFPNATFFDMLDGLSRMCDTEGNLLRKGSEGKKIPLRLRFPTAEEEPPAKKNRVPYRPKKRGNSVSRKNKWLTV